MSSAVSELLLKCTDASCAKSEAFTHLFCIGRLSDVVQECPHFSCLLYVLVHPVLTSFNGPVV